MPHNDQVTSFSAPLDDGLGPLQPFNTPDNRNKDTTLLGPKLFGAPQMQDFDPPLWMKQGRIKAMSCAVVGDINGAKSAFGKIISAEYAPVYNARMKQRIYADDHRRLNGVPEYARLAQFYNSKLSSFNSLINVFDFSLGLTLSDHLETAIEIYESTSDGQAPVRHMVTAMQAALYIMLVREIEVRKPSVERYAEILLRMGPEQGARYIKEMTNRKELVPSGAHATLEITQEDANSFYEGASNINWDDFRADAGLVGERVLRFLHGDFGETFGGEGSIADELSGRFAGFDYSGKNEQTVAFLVGFIWRIKNSALQRGDERFIFDIENHDENVNLWPFLSYGRAMAKDLKQRRGSRKLSIQTVQRLQDYETVGEANSQARSLATNAIKDIGFFVFAKHARKEDALYLQDKFSLADWETRQLQLLEKGQYAIKFDEEPLHFFEMFYTPVREWLVETNAALLSAATRR